MAFELKCKPCDYTGISQPYKAKSHRGIDLVNHKLYANTPLRATADGTVVAASYGAWDKSYGREVAIYHGNGSYTNYGHLSKIKCYVGKKVKAGDIIGYMGTTGNSTGIHLHFEVHKGRKWNRVNPYPYFKNKPVTPSGSTSSTSSSQTYKVGSTYTLQENMTVRVGAGSNKAKVAKKSMTADARKNLTSDGLLKKGTKVTCKATEKASNGGIWMQTPSGWICAIGGTGKVFIK